jgi:hypothetical protein
MTVERPGREPPPDVPGDRVDGAEVDFQLHPGVDDIMAQCAARVVVALQIGSLMDRQG